MTTTNGETATTNHSDSSKVKAGGPVVVDLGKQPRGRVKRLRRGEGRLMDEVRDCVAELRRTGKVSVTAEPIIVVVRQKEPKGRVRWPRF